ncbi:6-phosphogluconolactonase (cycloisomerase 2 family) [Sporomusaceae bacterium BoRhaA]|uniref:lactonase family protein n=1 Tax=Pelorhabdus rhamnosifermentans TaxID=2772457 RepID=UPI001C061ADC|nr:lactonase family protein [Pelorhabdus rhamnosifermentans]MBU2703987.1 6-phosphogluconolactonase (cycloisomerase 2 family) [Pelorhabdus rhamnosifermentans]
MKADSGNKTSVYAYVGCRTTKERNARGLGINVYLVDTVTGNWEHVETVKTMQENPSFLALDCEQNHLYTVHGDFGEVSAYKIDRQNGKLSFINQQSTNGKNPVHLVVDPTNKFLVVANYATSSLVTLPIQADGSLGAIIDLTELSGKPGPHRTQQGSSHPHHTMYDPEARHIFIPDKGVDKIFAFRLDAGDGKLIPAEVSETIAREGAAPRHIIFHPAKPFAYVANELDSTVTTYSYNKKNAELKPLQIIPCIPQFFTGNNTAAEIMIAPSGNFVYVSNRGHDSIGIFAVNQTTGTLSPIDWESSQGKGPRFFNFDPTGKFLYVANENSDRIVTFQVDAENGKLTATGQIIQTGSPVCIEFLSIN